MPNRKISIPSFDMTGKTVIVTGGSQGLGFGIAAAFCAYGANVVITARTVSKVEDAECDLNENYCKGGKEMKPLRIALTKGRLERDTVGLFEEMGLDCSALREKGRKLILPVGNGEIEAVLAKAADVITYVEHGVCDLGVVGKDTILENGTGFYEILDLGFGKCRFALAGPKNRDFFGGYSAKTIATKYPNVTRNYVEEKGMDVRIIKIEGSVELAPLLGLSDAIVDIVETGSTLKENGLEVIDDVAPISARLIANVASLKLRKQEIEDLADRMEAAKSSLQRKKEESR